MAGEPAKSTGMPPSPQEGVGGKGDSSPRWCGKRPAVGGRQIYTGLKRGTGREG